MDDDTGRLRLRIFAFVGLVLFGALFTRLWYLQGIESEEFQAVAESLVLREVFEEAPRGRILDRDGRVLVDNQVVDVVTVDKAVLEELGADELDELFYELAVAISRSGTLTKKDDIEREIGRGQYGEFDVVPVAVDVDPALLVFLGERPDQFPGVEVVSQTVRSYPFGTLAAHLLGYVGPISAGELEVVNGRIGPDGIKRYQSSDEIGKTGVESIFEDVLRGVPGVRYIEVDNRGRVVGERTGIGRTPVPGNDLVLTIDIDLQALAEEQLEAGLANARSLSSTPGEDNKVAAAGSVVATDPMTGELLAMASFPTYDPGTFVNGISFAEFERLTSPDNYQPILNRAIQENYAPGSTFKLITAFAALEEGFLAPDSPIVEARDGTIEDRGTYILSQCRDDFEAADTCEFSSPRAGLAEATFSLPEAISASSDVFFYKLASEGFFPLPQGPDGDEGIQEMARQFGLGTNTAIQLPYERPGVVPDRDYFDAQAAAGNFLRDGSQWFAGDTVLLSIGQGEMLLTPTQLVNAYATMANGGRVFQINVARETRTHDGEVVTTFLPREGRDLELDPVHFATVEQGLLGATTATTVNGTALEAFRRFPLASWPVAGKTGTAQVEGKADTSLFVAYGPVLPDRDPEIAISVVMEEAGFGSAVAAPVAAAVLEAFATNTVPVVRTVEETERAYNDLLERRAAEAEAAEAEAEEEAAA